MRLTRKDILIVFGVLMAFIVAATVHLPENAGIQNTMTPSSPKFALEAKKAAQKIKAIVELKDLFIRIHHR